LSDDYGNLGAQVCRLKRAAIDAYMKSAGWTIWDDDYFWQPPMQDSSGGGGYTYFTVSRPGASGAGGGDEKAHNLVADLFGWYGSDHEEYVPRFDEIRGVIDAAIAPFVGLPDPADFDSAVSACERAAAELWVGDTLGDNGPGELHLSAPIAELVTSANMLEGAAASTFRQVFVQPLPATVQAIQCVAAARWGSVVATQELWRLARNDVMDAVSLGITAFEAVKVADSADWAITLTIAEYVAAAAAILVPGAGVAASAVKFAALGIKLLQTTTLSDATSDTKVADYGATMTEFTGTLARLRADATTAEGEIRDNLLENLAAVRERPNAFELTRNRATTPDASGTIRFDEDVADAILTVNLPGIENVLSTIATRYGTVSIGPASFRSGSIGCGSTGPAGEVTLMSHLLWDLVKNLQTETARVRQAFAEVVADLTRSNAEAVEEINRLLAGLDDVTPYNPWD
jgi:hypothetical protein